MSKYPTSSDTARSRRHEADAQGGSRPISVGTEAGDSGDRGESFGTDMFTINEAARILRCSKAHLSNVLNGKVSSLPPLPHVSLGRRKLIRRIILQQWLENLEAGNRR